MNRRGLALLAALLVASGAARAQQDASDVAPALQSAVIAYRSGAMPTGEATLRALAPGNADAEAWLGAVLLGDRRRGCPRRVLGVRIRGRRADRDRDCRCCPKKVGGLTMPWNGHDGSPRPPPATA